MSDTDNTRHPAKASQPDSLDESLDEALNALEGMLTNRRVVPSARRAAPDPDLHDPVPDPDSFELEPDALPVLDQVVVPGVPPLSDPIHEPGEDLDDGTDRDPDAAAYRHPATGMLRPPPHDDLVARLVNEVNVIVETCVEDAMVEIKKELMARLKNHLDIVLPEIMEELFRRVEDDRD